MRILATIGMMLATLVGVTIIVAVVNFGAAAFGWYFIGPLFAAMFVLMFFLYYKAAE